MNDPHPTIRPRPAAGATTPERPRSDPADRSGRDRSARRRRAHARRGPARGGRSRVGVLAAGARRRPARSGSASRSLLLALGAIAARVPAAGRDPDGRPAGRRAARARPLACACGGRSPPGWRCVPVLRARRGSWCPRCSPPPRWPRSRSTGGRRWGQLGAGLGAIVGAAAGRPGARGRGSAARGVSRRAGAGPAARGAALAAVLLALFVPLLMSADAAFAQLLEDVVPTGWSVDAARRARRSCWRCSSRRRRAAARPPAPAATPAPTPAGARARRASRRRSRSARSSASSRVFVALQFATLFGGERHVLDTAGLTYAEYARSGFCAAARGRRAHVRRDRRRRAAGRSARRAPAEPRCACSRSSCSRRRCKRLGLLRGDLRLHAPAASPRTRALLYLGALFVPGARRALGDWLPRAIVAVTAGVGARCSRSPTRNAGSPTHNVDRYERTGQARRRLPRDARARTPRRRWRGVPVPLPCVDDDGIAGFNLARAAARRTSTDRRTAASGRCDPPRPTR